MSVWDVASGGRLGFVTGEDATEVANPPTNCTSKCQAQNQVRGRLAVLGFPFPVPAGSRLTPTFAAVPDVLTSSDDARSGALARCGRRASAPRGS